VAKQMVMTLGMSPEIGQRLLGGQQGGGPFMGRDLPGDFRDFSEDFGEKNSNFP
jgi:ATP-dependent Zn protease